MNAEIKIYSWKNNLLHTKIVCNNIKEAQMYAHGAYEMALKHGLKPTGSDIIDLDEKKERDAEAKGDVKQEITNEIANKLKSLIKETVDAGESRQRTVKVTFDDGNTITTRINGTKKEIEQHYINQTFSFDDYDHEKGAETEKTAKAVNVEFLN